MVIHEVDVPTFEVGFDLTFHDPEGQNIIHDLQEFGKARIQYEGRKSKLVVSQLVIAAGVFVLELSLAASLKRWAKTSTRV